MLKSKILLPILAVISVGALLSLMACEQSNSNFGYKDDQTKELIITLPTVEDVGNEIDKYEVKVFDTASSAELYQTQGEPGEAKTVTVLDNEEPLTIQISAFDADQNEVAFGETTASFNMDHDGLLCDLGFSVDLNSTSVLSLDATVDISVDCHLIDIVDNVIKFVDKTVHNVIDVSKYIVNDVIEDFFNIIDIIR
jgi:hypothetical protein